MQSQEPEALCAVHSEVTPCTVHTTELDSPDGVDAQQRDDDKQREGSFDEQVEQEGAPNAAPKHMIQRGHCPNLVTHFQCPMCDMRICRQCECWSEHGFGFCADCFVKHWTDGWW